MGAHYKAKEITVNNNFAKSDPMAWLIALAAASVESVAVFDGKMNLIYYNNRFGTLNQAKQDDLVDLYTLCEYYRNFYSNWVEALTLVRYVYRYSTPRTFELTHYIPALSCSCRVYPVLLDSRLGGVVWLAHRLLNGSKLQIGECNREQSTPSDTIAETPAMGGVFGRVLGRVTGSCVPAAFFTLSACGGP